MTTRAVNQLPAPSLSPPKRTTDLFAETAIMTYDLDVRLDDPLT
jgi:hypothetical protein